MGELGQTASIARHSLAQCEVAGRSSEEQVNACAGSLRWEGPVICQLVLTGLLHFRDGYHARIGLLEPATGPSASCFGVTSSTLDLAAPRRGAAYARSD